MYTVLMKHAGEYLITKEKKNFTAANAKRIINVYEVLSKSIKPDFSLYHLNAEIVLAETVGVSLKSTIFKQI